MRKAIALLLTALMLAHSGMQISTISYFYMHQAYIASNYCENTAKKNLHCEGKCYLSKTLLKQEKKAHPFPAVNKLKSDFFFQHTCRFNFKNKNLQNTFSRYTAVNAKEFSPGAVFRPPEFKNTCSYF